MPESRASTQPAWAGPAGSWPPTPACKRASLRGAPRQTDDPEVVVTEITHNGQSGITGAPYRFTALGVIRVRDGEIVRYLDSMDPIALARLLCHTRELATALSAT